MGEKGLILGGGGFMDNGAPRFVLAVVDLDAPSPAAELITLPFLPHGVVIDPRDPARAAVFEKKGPGACLVDLRARRLIRSIPTVATRRFYGHGAFSADGSLLYATESQLDQKLAGVLVVRDAKTLQELGTVPTHGAAPHDCLLVDEGKTLVVANGGGPIKETQGKGEGQGRDDQPAGVAYIELATGRLLDEVHLDSPRFNTGHIALTGRGDLAVVSAPRDGLPSPNQQLGAVTLRPHGGPTQTVQQPGHVVSRMLGETLSLVIDEADRVVLATHPLGGCVSMWRLDDGECLGTLELSGPRGITRTRDGAWYVVSHVAGSSVRLTAFSTATREPVGFHVDPSYTSGSHLYTHALA